MTDCDDGGIEAIRLFTLKTYDIVDTQPEAVFDAIVEDAVSCANVKMAAISIVEHNRQWFKAKVGLDINETSRSASFCAHAIQGSDIFLIEDAANDPRFADNPLVNNRPRIRFYAGFPLQASNGAKLGTLCVMDSNPHCSLTSVQIDALRQLSSRAMEALEAYKGKTYDVTAPEAPSDYARYQ